MATTLEKDGVTYELTNEVQITAFKNSGWIVPAMDDELADLEINLAAMDDDELRSFAVENGIEIPPQVSRRETMVERIMAAMAAKE